MNKMYLKDLRLLAGLMVLTAAALAIGCSRTAVTTANTNAAQPANITTNQNGGIELEIVQMQPIEGSLSATGKVLAMEDRTATLGPVHEGRIVNFYAGQGSVVRKGQKLADLESADLDDAEATYLKALADYENARRTSAAEVRLAQATYDRTKLLYEKTITAGKNLQTAEHDLEIAKTSAASSV